MKVKNLMTRDVATCRDGDNLAETAASMWRRDCGAIPVLDKEGRPAGMITDRDICIASATRGLPPARLTVGDVRSRRVFTCGQDQDVREALDTMRERQVRRLPVVDTKGNLVGIVSLNDIVLQAPDFEEGSRKKAKANEEVIAVMQSICQHPTPLQATAGAA